MVMFLLRVFNSILLGRIDTVSLMFDKVLPWLLSVPSLALFWPIAITAVLGSPLVIQFIWVTSFLCHLHFVFNIFLFFAHGKSPMCWGVFLVLNVTPSHSIQLLYQDKFTVDFSRYFSLSLICIGLVFNILFLGFHGVSSVLGLLLHWPFLRSKLLFLFFLVCGLIPWRG